MNNQANGTIRGVITSDEHAPFHDPKAIRLSQEIIEWWEPDMLILNGDQIDFYDLSSFDKNPDRKHTLQDEIDIWHKDVLEPQIEALGEGKKIIKVMGNHEDRLRRYLWKNPEISSLRSMRIESLLEFQKYNIEHAPKGILLNDKLWVTHGERVRKHAGTSARYEVDELKYAYHVVHGHVHRAGTYDVWTPRGHIIGQENPCLCNLQPEYMSNPDWRQGLTLFISTPTETHIQPIRFTTNYTALVGKKIISVA